jgi:hypothetical protein
MLVIESPFFQSINLLHKLGSLLGLALLGIISFELVQVSRLPQQNNSVLKLTLHNIEL